MLTCKRFSIFNVQFSIILSTFAPANERNAETTWCLSSVGRASD